MRLGAFYEGQRAAGYHEWKSARTDREHLSVRCIISGGGMYAAKIVLGEISNETE